MAHSKQIPFFTLIILLVACAAPPTALPPAPDINQLNTAIAQTAAAAVTQSMQASSPTSAFDILTPSPTFTPSFTPTLSPTAGSIFTPTSEAPLISVSISTNCRNGPGKIYGYQSALLVGQTAQVLAVDPTGKYWYIPDPASPGNFCWVWGQYATIIGNMAAVPVYTPPPTPTMTFTPAASPSSASSGGSGGSTSGARIQVTYLGLDSCSGEWWVEFKLTNIGEVNLKSIEMTLFDSDTHTSATILADGFKNVDGCSDSTITDVLTPQNSVVVSSPSFAHALSGHEVELTVRACSNPGRTGLCSSKKKIEFVP